MIDLHAGNLALALLAQNSQDTRERLDKKLRSFADGEIPHAADAFSVLFGILARYNPSDTHPGIENANPRAESKCTWAVGGNCNTLPHRKSMNIALIRSMHQGSFFDVGYRVRKRRVGADKFTPIYLCSSIFRDIRPKLDARRSCYILIRPALTSPSQWFKPTPISGRRGMEWIQTAIMKRSLQPAA